LNLDIEYVVTILVNAMKLQRYNSKWNSYVKESTI